VNIVIIILIALAIFFFASAVFNEVIDHPIEEQIKADFVVIKTILFAIFFLLLALTFKLY
jgi:hypothetical protein